MLDVMRKHAGSWMIKFIIAAITIVFVFWGVGSFRDKKGSVIAKVNDEPIFLEEYRTVYNNLLERLRSSFGDRLNDDLIKELNIKQQALNSLVERRLLLSESKRLKIRVTDRELTDAIARIDAFKKNGVFNPGTYQAVLAQNRIAPEQFEDRFRQDLTINKLERVISSGIHVSDAEALKWYNWQNASVKIAYVLIDVENRSIEPLKEQEIVDYYEKNRDDYRTEPKVKVRYVRFSPEDFMDKVRITGEEIEDYYRSHQSAFKVPEKAEARHILFKVAPDADEKSVQDAKKRAEDVMRMAMQGDDFAGLAKKYSQGPSASQGGLIGPFEKSQVVKPFADKVFSMKPGEISEPVRTRFGWHIIKLEKLQPKKTLSMEESRDGIEEILKRQKADDMARDEAEAFYDTVFEGDDLVVTAKRENLKVEETGYFTRKGPEGMPNAAAFAGKAFSLDEMEISEIQNFGDGYYIMQQTGRMESTVPPLSQVKERVINDLTRRRKEEGARKIAEDLLKRLNAASDFDSEAGKKGLKPEETDWFRRNDPIEGIGYLPELARAAFELSESAPYPGKVIKGPKGFYVIRFLGRKDPDPAGFEESKKNIRTALLQQKKYLAFGRYIKGLKEKSEITVEPGFLD